MIKRTASFLVLVLSLSMTGQVALAQAEDGDAVADPAVEEARALLQAGRKEIIKDEFRFSPVEEQAFWPAYDLYRKDIMEVRDRQAELVAEYLKAYREGSVSESMATTLVDDYLDMKQDLLSVQRRHLEAFRKILPPRKVGRFYQLENKLDAELDLQLAMFVPLMDPV